MMIHTFYIVGLNDSFTEHEEESPNKLRLEEPQERGTDLLQDEPIKKQTERSIKGLTIT